MRIITSMVYNHHMSMFSLMSVGESARIVGYHRTGPLADKLQSLGLVPGTSFTINRIVPLGDPIEVRVRGYNLGLRKIEGGLLRIEVVT